MADRPEVEAARDIAKRFIADLQDGLAPDKEAENILTEAILSAFPQIAPTEDVVSGAKQVLRDWCSNEMLPGDYATLTRLIAAFATAHAARERAEIAAAVRAIPIEQLNYHQAAIDMRALCLAAIRARSTP